jgi:hypothetical protein
VVVVGKPLISFRFHPSALSKHRDCSRLLGQTAPAAHL